MKSKRIYLNYLLYYFLGNMIFNMLFSIVKTIVINIIGGHELFIENLLLSFKQTFIFYTIVFILIVLINAIYRKYMIKRLNEKLNKIKERSDKNEK
ncbi:MAG: hypothetical protein HFJ40_06725 [Clostridia bacterium]|nr:hypothetical protein [Clostridia bacterium]